MATPFKKQKAGGLPAFYHTILILLQKTEFEHQAAESPLKSALRDQTLFNPFTYRQVRR
jgi:hypothetical protein